MDSFIILNKFFHIREEFGLSLADLISLRGELNKLPNWDIEDIPTVLARFGNEEAIKRIARDKKRDVSFHIGKEGE